MSATGAEIGVVASPNHVNYKNSQLNKIPNENRFYNNNKFNVSNDLSIVSDKNIDENVSHSRLKKSYGIAKKDNVPSHILNHKKHKKSCKHKLKKSFSKSTFQSKHSALKSDLSNAATTIRMVGAEAVDKISNHVFNKHASHRWQNKVKSNNRLHIGTEKFKKDQSNRSNLPGIVNADGTHKTK